MDLTRGRIEQVGATRTAWSRPASASSHHGELIGEEPVGALDHVVAGVGGEVDLLLALPHRKTHHPSARTRQAPARAPAAGRRGRCQGSGASRRAASGWSASSRRCRRRDRPNRRRLTRERGRVNVAAFALRTTAPSHSEAEAFQRGEDALGSAGDRARVSTSRSGSATRSAVGARARMLPTAATSEPKCSAPLGRRGHGRRSDRRRVGGAARTGAGEGRAAAWRGSYRPAGALCKVAAQIRGPTFECRRPVRRRLAPGVAAARVSGPKPGCGGLRQEGGVVVPPSGASNAARAGIQTGGGEVGEVYSVEGEGRRARPRAGGGERIAGAQKRGRPPGRGANYPAGGPVA